MIEGWMILVLFLACPLFFAVGFALGLYHVRRLAVSGGETRYPELVRDAVDAYRREYPGTKEVGKKNDVGE